MIVRCSWTCEHANLGALYASAAGAKRNHVPSVAVVHEACEAKLEDPAPSTSWPLQGFLVARSPGCRLLATFTNNPYPFALST